MKILSYQYYITQILRIFVTVSIFMSIAGCTLLSGGAEKPEPAELGVNVPILGVRQAWIAHLGSEGSSQLAPHVSGMIVTLASADGVVAAIDARTGAYVWQLNLGMSLVAGVGSDGQWTAVVSKDNELIVLEAGLEQWRHRLPAQVYTAPFVAGGRVFILAADRTVIAFDVASGRRLWSQSRSGDALILSQPGVLFAVGDNLIAGVSGRLVSLNPNTGVTRWEVLVASPRGINDVERLVELVGPVSRVDESVCVRAFQTAIGCVDTSGAKTQWTQLSSGVVGLDGDNSIVYGSQSNGVVSAWNRKDGYRIWSSERLQYRNLTAPLLLGRSVVIGDDSGLVHFLSRDDGMPLNRVVTDGSGIVISPVVAADTLIVITRKGNVFGFRPD